MGVQRFTHSLNCDYMHLSLVKYRVELMHHTASAVLRWILSSRPGFGEWLFLESSTAEVVRLVKTHRLQARFYCKKPGWARNSTTPSRFGTDERKWTSNLLHRKFLRRDSLSRTIQNQQLPDVIAGSGQSF